MNYRQFSPVVILALLQFCGCTTKTILSPEDSPYTILRPIWVYHLQDNLTLGQVVGNIENAVSEKYTNDPPFRIRVDPSLRSLKIHSRTKLMPATEFFRSLREATDICIKTKNRIVYIQPPQSLPPADVFHLPTLNYTSKTDTIFDVVSDINARLQEEYRDDLPVTFSASRNISTNETIRFMVGTPSVKEISDMLAHATLSNYRRTGKTIHFYSALADEGVILEPSAEDVGYAKKNLSNKATQRTQNPQTEF